MWSPPQPDPETKWTSLFTRRRIVPAVFVATLLGSILWSYLPPVPEDVNWKATTLTVRNETYWAANISLVWCNREGNMPSQAFLLAGVTFTMHYTGCFAPGGGSIQGEATGPGRDAWPFFLASRALPAADGFKLASTPDHRWMVGSLGHGLMVFVHV